jgi:hypothetical protein
LSRPDKTTGKAGGSLFRGPPWEGNFMRFPESFREERQDDEAKKDYFPAEK